MDLQLTFWAKARAFAEHQRRLTSLAVPLNDKARRSLRALLVV